MGSDENHFNVSVGSDEQNHKTVFTNHSLFEENGEPMRYRNEVKSFRLPASTLPLGQTGSLNAAERVSSVLVLSRDRWHGYQPILTSEAHTVNRRRREFYVVMSRVSPWQADSFKG